MPSSDSQSVPKQFSKLCLTSEEVETVSKGSPCERRQRRQDCSRKRENRRRHEHSCKRKDEDDSDCECHEEKKCVPCSPQKQDLYLSDSRIVFSSGIPFP